MAGSAARRARCRTLRLFCVYALRFARTHAARAVLPLTDSGCLPRCPRVPSMRTRICTFALLRCALPHRTLTRAHSLIVPSARLRAALAGYRAASWLLTAASYSTASAPRMRAAPAARCARGQTAAADINRIVVVSRRTSSSAGAIALISITRRRVRERRIEVEKQRRWRQVGARRRQRTIVNRRTATMPWRAMSGQRDIRTLGWARRQ